MGNLTVHQLRAHKRRLLSTFVAVALGVAFLSGTLVLGDTMRSTFDTLFDQVNAGTDAVVRPVRVIDDDDGALAGAVFDQSLLDRVRAVDGVERAEADVHGSGRIVGRDGKPVGSMGPPTMAGRWLPDERFNPYQLAEGRAPATDDEVVIDRGSAQAGQLHVGDRTVVQTPAPVPVTVVGIATFNGADNAGGSTFVGFTLEGAQQHVLHQPGKVTSLLVGARAGVSAEDLVGRLRPTVPAGIEAVTGTQVADEQKQAVGSDFLDFLNRFLLAFAAVALLVVTFSIYNAFSIIAAQRTREAALLRTLGATRRQVLTAALAETAIVGLAASALGVVSGVAIAAGLRSVMALLGLDLPATGLVLLPRTALLALVVGTAMTVLAGVLPARRSSRVAPLAALRDVSVDRSSASISRLALGTVTAAAGAALVLVGAGRQGDGRLPVALAGALLLVVGAVVVGPAVAALAGRVLGWPLAATRGATGRLARQNAVRNPRRTSGTAAALMVGVAVVALFTVVAQSVRLSISDAVGRSFAGDLVVTSGAAGEAAFSADVAPTVARVPEVRSAAALAAGPARVAGRPSSVVAVDPAALSQVLDLDVRQGSLAGLGPHQVAVSRDEVEARGWHLGSVVPVGFVDGTTDEFTVGAVYEPSGLVSGVVLRRADWTPHVVQDQDVVVLVKLHDGVALDAGRHAVEAAVSAHAGLDVQDRAQYVASVDQSIDQALSLVYVMLALAIVIALLGIANTLSLSILERTRELGLLRAVGQTRRQVRSMVRGESFIIALLGTLTGIGLGVFLGWGLVRAAADNGIGTFSVAPVQLLMITVAGGLAGVLAARRPARKAAGLNVLDAIATD